MLLTLDLIKQHCRIDSDDEDELLGLYESAAQQHIENQLDRKLFASEVPDDVANGLVINSAIKQAMLMTIAHWYEHRESVVIGVVSKEIEEGTWRLIQPYRIMGV